MQTIETVIIGGGQAGLALSRCLADRGLEHVVLERGRVGERWRSERWDSLRLLTPRWQSRLPGFRYEGPDPDGYMSRLEVVDYLERYARSFPTPLESGVTVTGVRPLDGGYRVETDQGDWAADHVVLATGECDTPRVPVVASRFPGSIHQVTPTRYKNPADLPDGGVLVVGASATGLQLALEIHASGRPVTLCVGRHTRLPRVYRGKDILWWLDRMGILDEPAHRMRNLEASRTQPSLQLVGTPERRTLDLGTAGDRGIRLVGRLGDVRDGRAYLADNLLEDMAASDLKLAALRLRIDEFAKRSGLDEGLPPPPPFHTLEAPEAPSSLDLRGQGLRSVLWATGFEARYPWLHVPVLDRHGDIIHDGGITPSPGLYVMGLRIMRRRSSSFIDGQTKDAEEIAAHLAAHRMHPAPALA